MRMFVLLIVAALALGGCASVFEDGGAGDVAISTRRPNIVYILADDMGYGDVRANNPQSKIPTPNLDALAFSGMRFTDAHSSSAVCTPTRYGIMTGRYNWRSRLQSGVLGGFSPRLIEQGRLTVASLLRHQGYATGCIGKWHLGMDFPLKGGGYAQDYPDGANVDWASDIKNGPRSVGFEYYYGISASLDMPPYVFIENERAVETPDREEELWPRRKGPVGPTFKLEEVLPRFTEKAVAFIHEHGREARRTGKPFFLYMPLNAPHTPIVPTDEWKGKSGINAYADFVMQTDASVGRVLKALEEAGVAKDTLVIFTSDNGCSPQAKFDELREKGHNPSYVFRGNKADIFEGGHRIPLIVRWPGRVRPGSVHNDPVCLTDFMATAAELLNVMLPDNAGEDSVSMVAALSGSLSGEREATVHHSVNGSFAIKRGEWKLILAADSGGWSNPRPGTPAARDLPPVQLYNLMDDIGETTNVAAAHPQIVAELTSLLEHQVAEGRSTPGAKQANTVPVEIRKTTPAAAPKKAPGKNAAKKATAAR